MQSWPNKEQLQRYIYQGDFGTYGEDLLEIIDYLDEHEIQQQLRALFDTMPLFVDDPIPTSKKERRRAVHDSIQRQKISDNIRDLEVAKSGKRDEIESSALQRVLFFLRKHM